MNSTWFSRTAVLSSSIFSEADITLLPSIFLHKTEHLPSIRSKTCSRLQVFLMGSRRIEINVEKALLSINP